MLIFLDCDGVINNTHCLVNSIELYAIEPSCLEVLKQLRKEINGTFVISSTWRILNDKEQFIQHIGEWIRPHLHEEWKTPGTGGFRGSQIQEWLLKNNLDEDLYEPYICLDDDSDYFNWQPLYLVNPETGLVSYDIKRIKRCALVT